MLFKSAPVSVSQLDEEAGTFEAVVSVFGNQDSYGDVVMPGAFTKTLEEWAAKGDPIPVYWSHRMDDPDYNIGHVVEAKETDKGLWVKAQLDTTDAAPSSKAPQVYRLLKGRRVTQFSFAYDEVDAGQEKTDGKEFRALRELKLYEVGPTPIGANQETELLAVKAAADVVAGIAAGVKAGRVLSAKNESALRAAHEAIGGVLDALNTDDTAKANGTSSAKDEEPDGAKSEEPDPNPPAKNLLSAQIQLLALT